MLSSCLSHVVWKCFSIPQPLCKLEHQLSYFHGFACIHSNIVFPTSQMETREEPALQSSSREPTSGSKLCHWDRRASLATRSKKAPSPMKHGTMVSTVSYLWNMKLWWAMVRIISCPMEHGTMMDSGPCSMECGTLESSGSCLWK